MLEFHKRIMRVFIVVLGLICATCALPRQQRIVGGEITTIESYPFMAAMLDRMSTGDFIQGCGGTLVTPTAVLSAAHCFSPNGASTTRVRLGSAYASSGGTQHLVYRIIWHEQYNVRLVINDIAVLRLTDPAVYSNQINRARIAGANYILPTNTVVHAAGWGNTEYQGQPSEILRHVAVNVIDHQICTERYAYLKIQSGMYDAPEVTPEMLCTGILNVGGKDACHQDSGGPVIHNNDVLVGIISWGYECAHPSYPGVNVRVSSYTDWINSTIINSVN